MGFVANKAKKRTLFYTRFDTLLILCVLKHNRLEFKNEEDLLYESNWEMKIKFGFISNIY